MAAKTTNPNRSGTMRNGDLVGGEARGGGGGVDPDAGAKGDPGGSGFWAPARVGSGGAYCLVSSLVASIGLSSG